MQSCLVSSIHTWGRPSTQTIFPVSTDIHHVLSTNTVHPFFLLLILCCLGSRPNILDPCLPGEASHSANFLCIDERG